MADLRMRVADFMSREIVTADASERLDTVADLMRLGRLRHVPILSRGRLVGILTQRDVFHAASSSVSGLRPESARDWMANVAVTEVMETDVVTTEPNAPVRTAAEMMLLKKIGCLPVIDQGKLVGLISETDCLRLLAALLACRDHTGAREREGGIRE